MTKLVKLSDVEEMINGRIEQLRKPSFPSEKTIGGVFHLKKLLSSLSSLPTQNEWISVEDKLPLQYMHVIATDGKTVGEAVYDSEIFLWGDDYNYTCDCIAWMPLPLPPTN